MAHFNICTTLLEICFALLMKFQDACDIASVQLRNMRYSCTRTRRNFSLDQSYLLYCYKDIYIEFVILHLWVGGIYMSYPAMNRKKMDRNIFQSFGILCNSPSRSSFPQIAPLSSELLQKK
jgi:hypothetical protein